MYESTIASFNVKLFGQGLQELSNIVVVSQLATSVREFGDHGNQALLSTTVKILKSNDGEVCLIG